jgi:hypothetical protein
MIFFVSVSFLLTHRHTPLPAIESSITAQSADVIEVLDSNGGREQEDNAASDDDSNDGPLAAAQRLAADLAADDADIVAQLPGLAEQTQNKDDESSTRFKSYEELLRFAGQLDYDRLNSIVLAQAKETPQLQIIVLRNDNLDDGFVGKLAAHATVEETTLFNEGCQLRREVVRVNIEAISEWDNPYTFVTTTSEGESVRFQFDAMRVSRPFDFLGKSPGESGRSCVGSDYHGHRIGRTVVQRQPIQPQQNERVHVEPPRADARIHWDHLGSRPGNARERNCPSQRHRRRSTLPAAV